MNECYKTLGSFTRIGNVKYNLKKRRILKMLLYTGTVFAILLIIAHKLISNYDMGISYEVFQPGKHKEYNSTYPLSPPRPGFESRTYKILAIADLDTKSKLNKDGHKYSSFLLKGELQMNNDLTIGNLYFENEPSEITSQYAYGDRGMELSELVVFNGRLYSCDDRTGIVYEIQVDKRLAIPWVILADGDGTDSGKGFKCEWMTVKDAKLYVGGLGKEWTTPQGVLVNHNPQWIKVIGHLGDVTHIDWTENYNKIRSTLGYSYPGYMIFESCVWNRHSQRFFFLPRRASADSYDEVLDEQRATNLMIDADYEFTNVAHKNVGEIIPTRGYSSFKFVPGTKETILIALKTEEDQGQTRSFMTVLDISGNVLVEDIQISSSLKYEGIEFV